MIPVATVHGIATEPVHSSLFTTVSSSICWSWSTVHLPLVRHVPRISLDCVPPFENSRDSWLMSNTLPALPSWSVQQSMGPNWTCVSVPGGVVAFAL